MGSVRSIVVLLLTIVAGGAQAKTAAAVSEKSPRAELKAAIEQLQKTPDDAALREKIINLARTVKPAPAIPEEARKKFVQAVALQKEAKDSSDYSDVIARYDQALLIAPWWGDAYYNLSAVDEAAGRFDAAMGALKLFLMTKPKDEEARKAQDRLYVLEAKSQRAAKTRVAKEDGARAKSSLEGYWKDGTRDAEDMYQAVKGSGGEIVFLYLSMPEASKNNPLENFGYRGVVTRVDERSVSVDQGQNVVVSCQRVSAGTLECDGALSGAGAGHGFARYHKCASATNVGDNQYGRHLWHCE